MDIMNMSKYRLPSETDNHWFLRKQFLLKNINKYPEDELITLSKIFLNIVFLGHRYDISMMKTMEAMSSGIVGLPRHDGIQEQQKRYPATKTSYDEPDSPQESLEKYPFLPAAKKNIPSTSTSENCERIDPIPRFSDRHIVKDQYSRSSTLQSGSNEEINMSVRRTNNDDRDNSIPQDVGHHQFVWETCSKYGSPSSLEHPFNSANPDNLSAGDKLIPGSKPTIPIHSIPFQSPVVQSIDPLTSDDKNELSQLSHDTKNQGLQEKLTNLSKWLKKKKLEINVFSVSNLLKSAMNFFNLNLRYQWLPEVIKSYKRVLLLCSLGNFEVLICSSKYRKNEKNPEQIVCLRAVEKLCQPFLKVCSEPGRMDMIITSDFPIRGRVIPKKVTSYQMRRNERARIKKEKWQKRKLERLEKQNANQGERYQNRKDKKKKKNEDPVKSQFK